MDENTGMIEAIGYIELTVGLVSAYVANNSVPAAELATLIATTHAALAGLGGTALATRRVLPRLRSRS